MQNEMSQQATPDVDALFLRILSDLSLLSSGADSALHTEQAYKSVEKWLTDRKQRIDAERFNSFFLELYDLVYKERDATKVSRDLIWLLTSGEDRPGDVRIAKRLQVLENEVRQRIPKKKMDWKITLAWVTAACVAAALIGGVYRASRRDSEQVRKGKRESLNDSSTARKTPSNRAPTWRPDVPVAAEETFAQSHSEPHVLSLIIPVSRSAYLEKLAGNHLSREDTRYLRGNCTWIWYGTRVELDRTAIGKLLETPSDRNVDTVFDVCCVLIEIPKGDERLAATASAAEQHLAFADLEKTSVAIQVSRPFPEERLDVLPFRRA